MKFLLIFIVLVHKVDSQCRDLVPCQRAAGYCRMPHLVRTLTINCPLTCGYCQQQQPAPNPGYPVQNPYNGYPVQNPYNGYPNYPANPLYPPPNNGNPPQLPNPIPANPPIYTPPIVPPAPIVAPIPQPVGPPTFTYPNFTLRYFKIRFRGEPIRLMLHYKKIPFNDIITKESAYSSNYAAYSDDKYPLLLVDNVPVRQYMTIYRYLGRKLNMFGTDDLETAYLDYVAELWREFIDITLKYKSVATKLIKGNEKNMHDKTFVPVVNKYFPQMETLLSRSTSGFFGSEISWVDFYVAGTIQTFMFIDPTTILGYTRMSAHNDRIYKLKQLQPYFKKNQPTNVL
ncbi:Glutathione S-transferase-like protein [Aphelenchoides bicaudatus]|nr:Glutathione S-transferase-like protein [Aphelenchoides bicaudatus]